MRRTWQTCALFLTVVLLVSACGQSRDAERERALQVSGRARPAASADSSSAPRSAAARVPKDPTHRALAQAFDRLKTAYPYRLTDTSTVTTSIGIKVQPMVRVSEHPAPDRTRMQVRRGELLVEIIEVGDTVYTRANGTWRTADRRTALKPSAELESMLAEDITDVQMVGTDTLDGVPASAYTFRFRWKAFGMIFDGTGKAWVRADDGLPQRAEMETRTGLFDMKSQVAYEYEVPVEVEAPTL